MATTILTPQEILNYGQRVVLFPTGKGRAKQEFVIDKGRVFQQVIEYIDGKKHIIKTNPVELKEIYNQIERVYSHKSKGVLIGRRSGNYKSNKERPLPLKKTGKGMGEMLRGAQLAKIVYQVMDEDNEPEAVKSRAKQRITKENERVKRDNQKNKQKQYA